MKLPAIKAKSSRQIHHLPFFLFIMAWLLGCAPDNLAPNSVATDVLPTTAVLPTKFVLSANTPTALPLPEPAHTAVPLPTVTTAPAVITAANATSTPDPLFPYTLAGLYSRDYPAGVIQILETLEVTDTHTRSLISYPSDDLTITGIMQTPPGAGPFPVIILLHGYVDRDAYWPGADTWQAANYLNEHGYLTLAPDFRSWGGSDVGASLFHMGLTADTLNLMSAVPSLPQADSDRIGLWGHSMGGGIGTKVLTVDNRIKAAVLYAPNSANDADLIARWGVGCLPGQSEAAGDTCNPAEVISPELAPEVVTAYLETAVNASRLREVAPIYHLEQITAPIQIHIGTADGQGLSETPPEWSQALADALLVAGKEATLYSYPGQGHFFSGESWSLFMERTVDFFDAKLEVERRDD